MQELFMQDLDIFFQDLAEQHTINGKEIPCIIDNKQLIYRSKKEYDGISVGTLLFFAKVDDFQKEPKEEDIFIFDNKPMKIFSVRKDTGMYEIILNQNVGG